MDIEVRIQDVESNKEFYFDLEQVPRRGDLIKIQGNNCIYCVKEIEWNLSEDNSNYVHLYVEKN